MATATYRFDSTTAATTLGWTIGPVEAILTLQDATPSFLGVIYDYHFVSLVINSGGSTVATFLPPVTDVSGQDSLGGWYIQVGEPSGFGIANIEIKDASGNQFTAYNLLSNESSPTWAYIEPGFNYSTGPTLQSDPCNFYYFEAAVPGWIGTTSVPPLYFSTGFQNADHALPGTPIPMSFYRPGYKGPVAAVGGFNGQLPLMPFGAYTGFSPVISAPGGLKFEGFRQNVGRMMR